MQIIRLTAAIVTLISTMTNPAIAPLGASEKATSEFEIKETSALALEAIREVPLPSNARVNEKVSRYFRDIPILAKVAECESNFRHFDTGGKIIRGTVNKSDVGVMQINEHYHRDVARRIGVDLYTLEGNLAYARYLYSIEGTEPWSASEACWSKFDELAKK